MKKLLIAFLIITYHSSLISQNVAINNTGAPANPSAMLDVNSTTAGFLPPRMTTAQMNAIASPATGLMVLNTTTNCLMIYLGSSWQSIFCGCTGAPSAPGAISGPTAVCADTTGKIYSVSAVFGANSYTWSVPAGATITAGQGTPSITITFGSTPGNVSVTAGNSCGASAASVLSITVNTVPTAVTATASPNPVCAGNTLTLTGSATGAVNWSWTGPNSFSSSSQSPVITNTTASEAGIYSLTASNGCGSATPVNTASVAVHTIQYVPITLTNNQSTATGTNFQQMVTVNSSNYSSNESSGLQNIEFTTGTGATGNVLQAWIESGASNTSGNTVYWVNLGSNTIAGNGGTLTIYMNFMLTNVMSSSGPTGEAPQLSGNYGQYDNGADVFSFYDSFAGNSLSNNWTVYSSGSGTATINNGITISFSSNSSSAYVITSASSYPAPLIAETYAQGSGAVTNSRSYMPGLTTVTAATEGLNILDQSGYFNMAYSNGRNGVVTYADVQGNSSAQFYNNIGTPSGFNIIGLGYTASNNTWFMNYGSVTSSNTDSPTGNVYFAFGLGEYGGGNPSASLNANWARLRAYPPNGTIPGVSIGSETCQ